MVSTAWSGAHDADLVCVLLDAREGIDEEADAILTKLATVGHEKILVLNKIDLVPREKLLALAKAANDRLGFARTFMVSALSGDGVDDLRHTLAEMVPPGPFHYPEDQMSDAPMRHLAAEITREKIFRQLHQELPYQSTVETDSWTERKDKSIRIEQTIFVERESQRKIVLGKGGATIKSIGAEARKEIAEIVGVPVHLFLFVKVRENWGDDPDRYREMGLEFPKGISGIAPMNLPKNVLWFEVLLYASLVLDALSVAFQDRTPSADMTEQMIGVYTVMAALPDPAAGLFRLARRAPPQELAALGAARGAGAVRDLAGADHRRDRRRARQRDRDRLLRPDRGGAVFFLHRRRQGLVQRVVRRCARVGKGASSAPCPPLLTAVTCRRGGHATLCPPYMLTLPPMEWTDEGIVLGVRRHGESSAIVELLTRGHGRHLGLVRGGAGSRMRPLLQPGNSVRAVWRARLDEHLGYYVIEGTRLARGDRAGVLARGLWRDPSGLAGAAVAGARSAPGHLRDARPHAR